MRFDRLHQWEIILFAIGHFPKPFARCNHHRKSLPVNNLVLMNKINHESSLNQRINRLAEFVREVVHFGVFDRAGTGV